MKEIQLTQGKVAIVDDEDYQMVNQFKWYALKNGNTFYARRVVPVNGRQKTVHMHQFIIGDTPKKSDIDHKDGNGCNNQKLNLRICTHQENMMNQKKPDKNCTSIYKGVCWHKRDNKWQSRIQIDGKLIHIGYFMDESDAARAYDKAAKHHFKEFAYLNFNE